MIKNTIICMPLNSRLDDGCDYAVQTAKILSKDNTIFAVVLAEPLTWKDLGNILLGQKKILWISDRVNYIRPFYILPFQKVELFKSINIFLTAFFLYLYIQVKFFSRKKILWFFEPHNLSLFLNLYKGYFSIFDIVDEFFTHKPLTYKKYFFQKPDLVTVNSQTLFDKNKTFRKDLRVVPQGFNPEIFDVYLEKKLQAKKTKKNKSFVVGFIGGVNYRLDFEKLFYVIGTLKETKFRFVGPQQLHLIPGDTSTEKNIKKLLSLSNVEWIDNVPKTKVSQYLDEFDVCLIPYDLSYPFNKYCFPMKVMDYFYFGKPIISTRILELERYQDTLTIIDTKEEFVRSIKKFQTKRWGIDEKNKQRKVAQENTWKNKVTQISQEIEKNPLFAE